MMPTRRSVLALLSIVFISIFLSTLTKAEIVQLKNDNGEFYAGSWAGRIRGDIDGAVFTPEEDLFPITLQSVQFGLHRSPQAPWITDSARVRVQIYAIQDGVVGDILAESEPQVFSTLDNWLSLPLTAPLTFEEPTSFMAAVKWESGDEDAPALPLALDSNFDAPQETKDQLNLFHREDVLLPEACQTGFCTHSQFWGEPENVGFNMIRVTVDAPQAPTATPISPTLTATAMVTVTPQPTPHSNINAYLPTILRGFQMFTQALTVGNAPGQAESYVLTSGDTMANLCWPGATNNLWVGRESADERGIMRSVIRFDLSAVPLDAVLVKAGLRLVAVDPGADTTPMTVSVHDITQPWAGCPTWNDLADAVGTSWASLTVDTGIEVHTVDVTGLVRGWLSGDLPNYGLMLRGDEEQVGRIRGFVPTASSQEDLRPTLILRYR